MSKKQAMKPAKISLYGKPIKMTPKISLFAADRKSKFYKPVVSFWPNTEEETDDRLPENK